MLGSAGYPRAAALLATALPGSAASGSARRDRGRNREQAALTIAAHGLEDAAIAKRDHAGRQLVELGLVVRRRPAHDDMGERGELTLLELPRCPIEGMRRLAAWQVSHRQPRTEASPEE